MSARLTVIIPGYETPEWMWRRCLGSVLRATTKEDEIICVDDGSQENIMPRFNSKRIKEIRLEKNSGQSNARNQALKQARGKWITFVDSDDALVEDVYVRCLLRLKCTGDDIAVFGVQTIWPDVRLCKDDVPRMEFSGKPTAEIVRELFESALFEYSCNKVYRKDFLLSHNVYFDASVCPGEDTIFNIAAILAGARLCSVSYVGYKYFRSDGTSLSRYLPNIRESRRKYCLAWSRLRHMLDEGSNVLSGIGQMDEKALDSAEWVNMWRRKSPCRFSERLRYARMHGFSFIRMALRCVARRCFYFGVFRAMKIRQSFPQVYKY